MANLAQIYDWYMTGKKPTQAQFWASWGSFWNKEETIPQSAISNLGSTLSAKTENDQFNDHKVATDAHADLFLSKEDKTQKGVSGGYAPLDEFSKIAHQFLSIVNNLTDGSASDLLSGEQGVVLQTQINNINILLASDNVNLDNVQELVDAIETVQTSLETILVNDLTTGGTTKALTAEMGKTLKGLIDAVNSSLGVVQKDIAYVDINGNNSTAILGNIRKPYLTIDAALDALPSTGGVIKISVGTFNSPTDSKIKSNISFIGSGKPLPNYNITYIDEFTKPIITSPTKLVGGTILNGKLDISFKDNITIKDLGVDCGKFWIDTYNGGVGLDCIVSAQDISFPPQSNSPQTKGLKILNISSLGYSSTSLFHNLLVENSNCPQIANVSTYFALYGLVLKNTGGNVVNYDGHGHFGAGIILKSDTYAYGQNINISNIYLSSIGDYDCAGISLDGGTGTLQRVNISNANLEYTQFGIRAADNKNVDFINISNVNIYKSYYNAIYLPSKVKNANLTNISVNYTTVDNGVALFSDSGGVKIISNSKVSNCQSTGFVLSTTGSGKIIVNGLDSYNNVISYNIYGDVYGSNITKNTNQIGNLLFNTYGNIRALKSYVEPNGGVDANINILASNTDGFSGIGILAKNTASSFIHFGDTDNSSIGSIGYYHGDDSLSFRTNGVEVLFLKSNGVLKIPNLLGLNSRMVSVNLNGELFALTTYPVHADNASAISGGLGVGEFYRTGTGILMVRY